MIRFVLFDLDGTLVDSYGPITASLNEVRKRFGRAPRGEAEVRREVGRGLEALIADNVGGGNVEEGVRIFREHYRRVFREGTRPLPGVGETIPQLAGRGYGMAVVSNKPALFSRQILDALGLAGCFGAVYGPDMVSRPKPDPEMLHRAIADLGGDAARGVYVGDMVMDVEVARNAGLPAWVIASGGHGREELEKARPARLLDSFESLLGLLPPLERRRPGISPATPAPRGSGSSR